MSRLKSLLFLLALATQVPLAFAKVTYAAGACEPSLPSFATISAALAAAPAPNVVEICPGTYPEQVVISFPVTLEGISSGDSGQAIIAVPASGLGVNAADDFGDSLAVQVVVKNAAGEVNLSNLTVDGTGNNVTSSGVYVVGVFYQNSPGTINHLTVQNQNGNGFGVGVWLEGGSAKPSVTVENSNQQAFDYSGINAETAPGTSTLTATIIGNVLASSFTNSIGITLEAGETVSVSSNLITGSFEGVLIDGGEGSVSKNKVVNTGAGIDLETDGVSVTSNIIYAASSGYGIGIVANSAAAQVTGNTIAQSPIAIDFDCTSGNNVHSNTILGAVLGLINVPTAAAPANTYYNVGTNSSGGC